jgi:hypothetical protein
VVLDQVQNHTLAPNRNPKNKGPNNLMRLKDLTLQTPRGDIYLTHQGQTVAAHKET